MQLQKREKQAKKSIKRQAQLAGNVINFFERNLNSFLVNLFYHLSGDFPL